jgi:hypothetical protein
VTRGSIFAVIAPHPQGEQQQAQDAAADAESNSQVSQQAAYATNGLWR